MDMHGTQEMKLPMLLHNSTLAILHGKPLFGASTSTEVSVLKFIGYGLFGSQSGSIIGQEDFYICQKKPAATPTTTVFQQKEPPALSTSSLSSQSFDCTMATANILTLLPQKSQQGLQGKTRLTLLQDQFHRLGCHIVGIQETRHQKECRVNQDRYLIFSAPATPKGQYGVQIWISKSLTFGRGGEKIEQKHVKILNRDPRRLLLEISAPFFRAILVCGHAPTMQDSSADREQWWNELKQMTPIKLRSWPHLLMLDANARVGTVISKHIGDHQPSLQDSNGDLLHDYLCEVACWLPSTHSCCHHGEDGTWFHPKVESWSRGNYIGVPLNWKYTGCESWLPDELDLSLTREDHRAACVKFSWTATTKLQEDVFHQQRPAHDLALLQQHLQGPERHKTLDDLAAGVGRTTWGVDVHTHMFYLQTSLQRWMGRHYLRGRHKPRRRMSNEAWLIVKEKQQARLHIYHHNNALRRRLLQGCFDGWKGRPTGSAGETAGEAQTFAQHLHRFRCLGQQITAILRREDKKFFDGLAAEAGEMDAPHRCKEFWAKIRGALPKTRNKSKTNPLALEILDSEWLPHFAKLEAGEVTTAEDLLKQCTSRPIAPPAPGARSLDELPTRYEVEQTLRTLQPGKAPGPDGLPPDLFHHGSATLVDAVHDIYSKAAWWATGPIQSKGGTMFPIHKRGSVEDAANFRGLMLLNVLSKTYHKWLRQRVARRLDDIRLDTLLGGFRGQQAAFGAHCIQSVGTVAHLCDQPMTCLFVDIQSAYHFLVRELVVGAGESADIASVMANLETWKADTTGLNLWLKLAGILERAHIWYGSCAMCTKTPGQHYHICLR